jgi:predicted transcriptional regulator
MSKEECSVSSRGSTAYGIVRPGMKHRRSSIEVIADILRLRQAGKTEIMYSTNMSYYQLRKYLDLLMEHGLMDRVDSGNSIGTYRTTRKGLRLVKRTDDVLAMLSQGDPVDSFAFNQGLRV